MNIKAIVLSILMAFSVSTSFCIETQTTKNATMLEIHKFFQESENGTYNFRNFFKEIKPLIDKEVISELMFLYTSSDFNNEAAFFLGLCDYYGITGEINFLNSSRFFEYVLHNSKNIYIKNWAFLYMLSFYGSPLFKVNKDKIKEICKENIDLTVLSENEKKIFKKSMAYLRYGYGISLCDMFP